VSDQDPEKYMLYVLSYEHERLYGFNLKNGRLEQDLKLPVLEKEKWIKKVEVMKCLNEGLELLVSFGKKTSFVFFKDYKDSKISISDQSVIDVQEQLKKEKLHFLEYDQDKKSKFNYFTKFYY
jgi:hypothetical protein